MKKKLKIIKLSDLKLQAFLRTLFPELFIKADHSQHPKIFFLFHETQELSDAINGYLRGESFSFSPLSYAERIDQGKKLIFGNYKN